MNSFKYTKLVPVLKVSIAYYKKSLDENHVIYVFGMMGKIKN